MHPLNSKFFGSGPQNIKVAFHNGTTVVEGYIVKQVSWLKWRVSDGQDKYTVKLAKDGAPGEGEFTIDAFPLKDGVPGEQTQVIRIDGHHITTIDDERYIWTLEDKMGEGYAKLDVT